MFYSHPLTLVLSSSSLVSVVMFWSLLKSLVMSSSSLESSVVYQRILSNLVYLWINNLLILTIFFKCGSCLFHIFDLCKFCELFLQIFHFLSMSFFLSFSCCLSKVIIFCSPPLTFSLALLVSTIFEAMVYSSGRSWRGSCRESCI